MTVFSVPERLNPAHIWMLLQSGTLDVGALLCYGALILVAVLFLYRLHVKNRKSAYLLLGALIVIGLTVALSSWPDRVPPLYFSFGDMRFESTLSTQISSVTEPEVISQ